MANFEDDGRWRTLGREYLYESPWCSFRVDEARLPDGAEIEYGVLESAGFAAVAPVTEGAAWCSCASGASRSRGSLWSCRAEVWRGGGPAGGRR